jgi:multidrug efflux pump subunit AcrB
MLQPLAIAVIGGLAISLLLSLVVTPVMYLLMHGGAAAEVEES